MLVAVTFTIVLCAVLLKLSKKLYALITYRFAIAKLPAVKRPAYPLVGHAYLFKPDAFPVFNELCREMINDSDEKFAVIWTGSVPSIVVYHPDAAHVLLRNSTHMEKPPYYKILKSWLGDGLVFSSGEKWVQRRRLITPTFHFKILEDFLAVMNEQSLILMDKLTLSVSRKQEVDVMDAVGRCALDIICQTAMGCDVNAQRDSTSAYVEAVHQMLRCFMLRKWNPLYAFDFIFNMTKLGKQTQGHIRTLHDFTRKVIAERMEANKPKKQASARKRMALLDVLLMAQTDDGHTLTAADIQEEVDTFMFAGHDTTKVALTWAIYLLGRNPQQQRRLQAELDSVFDGLPLDAPVTSDHLHKLTYLDQVIKEAMRVYPPVPIMSRVTAEDCMMSGHRIPKGSHVTLFIYMMHHNPKVWTDPECFDPERFNKRDERDDADRSPYSYIPFSAGPRNCVGQRFALQEQKVVLSMFFRRFSVRSHDDETSLPLTVGVVMWPRKPLRITIANRN